VIISFSLVAITHADTRLPARLMQRRQRRVLLEFGEHLRVDAHWGGVERTASSHLPSTIAWNLGLDEPALTARIASAILDGAATSIVDGRSGLS